MADSLKKQDSNVPRRWFERGPLASLREEMDDLFENFMGSQALSRLTETTLPSIDVSETDGHVEVKTDVPGMKADDIKVEIKNDQLTISGETSEEHRSEEGEGRKFHRVERRTGRFSRSVRLPCAVKEDCVEAELKDGVLTISLPKAEQETGRKIQIKS